ncbi:MAG: helix-turn-helix domain-containing protein, partial [Bacteroidota bacterium]
AANAAMNRFAPASVDKDASSSVAPVYGDFPINDSREYPVDLSSTHDPVEPSPIIVDRDLRRAYAQSEVVEENLSLAANEKELIKKALKKHGGRRKEAANELGISERTLYRKIKDYELTE